MQCPFCNSSESSVTDTRMVNNQSAIKRRRQCKQCKAKFSTLETIQSDDFIVVKKSGGEEFFDKSKLERSLKIALRKRKIDTQATEKMVNTIVDKINTAGKKRIPSKAIGDFALALLAQTDMVAYVRFASVYREFQTAEDFTDILKEFSLENSIKSF